MHRLQQQRFILARGIPLLALLLLLLMQATAAAQPAGPIYTIRMEGVVNGPMIEYARRAIQAAESAGATALIIELSSSGGVLRDMRVFAGDLAAARVPIVVYVTPAGTQSGAAGAFLLSGAHMSALAPQTSFGSPYPLTQVDAVLTEQTRNLVLDSVANQLIAWNAARGRNTEWLDRAVREGVIINNEQAAALQPPAVDLIAASREELLVLLEGRDITLANGQRVRLTTIGRGTTAIEPTIVESLWLTLADPTVAFALLVRGAMGISLELASPGIGVFAGSGVVLLIMAAIGLVALPVQPWGLLLLLGGLFLIGLEFFTPSHGGLTVTGLALLVIGALNLIDITQAPGTGVAPWVVIVVGLGLSSAAIGGLVLGLRSRSRPTFTGQSSLIGKIAEVRQPLQPRGMVFVDGALWQAISETRPVQRGDHVRVISVHQLQLIVRPLDEEATENETS